MELFVLIGYSLLNPSTLMCYGVFSTNENAYIAARNLCTTPNMWDVYDFEIIPTTLDKLAPR